MLSAAVDPPYVAVIFTSVFVPGDGPPPGYDEAAAAMDALVCAQPGFLGQESARGADGLGLTVSYWADVRAAAAWKQVAEHLDAQRLGVERFYASYLVRIATVERAYDSGRPGPGRPGPALPD